MRLSRFHSCDIINDFLHQYVKATFGHSHGRDHKTHHRDEESLGTPEVKEAEEACELSEPTTNKHQAKQSASVRSGVTGETHTKEGQRKPIMSEVVFTPNSLLDMV